MELIISIFILYTFQNLKEVFGVVQKNINFFFKKKRINTKVYKNILYKLSLWDIIYKPLTIKKWIFLHTLFLLKFDDYNLYILFYVDFENGSFRQTIDYYELQFIL